MSTLNKTEIELDYLHSYGKPIDWKTVPCVIATDKILSKDENFPGWGPPDGKAILKQVILCANTQEAADIEYNMKAIAKREKLTRIQKSVGFRPNRDYAYSFILACDAIAFGGNRKYCVTQQEQSM